MITLSWELWDPGSLICQYLTQAYQKTFNRTPEKQTFSCSFEILACFSTANVKRNEVKTRLPLFFYHFPFFFQLNFYIMYMYVL